MQRHTFRRKLSSLKIPATLLLLCLVIAPGCKKQTPTAPPQTAAPNKPTKPAEVTAPNEPAKNPADTNEVAAIKPKVVSAPNEPLTFDLEETSTFDLPQEIRYRFILGQYTVNIKNEPDEQVKAYPDFESDSPLYGSISVGGEPGKPDTGLRYHFAIDESQGTDRGYDWLYFDNDCDGDLSDEISQKPLQDPPDGAKMQLSSEDTQVCFEHVKVKTNSNSNADLLEVMPRLLALNNRERRYLFLVPINAMKGQINIGNEKYNAFLGYGSPICSGLDHPATLLHIVSAQDKNMRLLNWTGGQQLKAMPLIDGKYYRFSATPDGHKLSVQIYSGPFGALKLGPGNRDIEEMTIQGSLQSEDVAVAISLQPDQTTTEKATTFRLPVGDYLPGSLSIKYGDLQLLLLQNAHSDGIAQDTEKTWIYGISIRQDKPFVFDFSNDPKIIFASPAKDHRIKRDEELKVEAVLTDSVLDIMFRMLRDNTSGGNNMLNPTVIISRADGEQLAEGVMPFG